MKYYPITWWTFFFECWCNGLLNCVPFTYQKIFVGNRYTLKSLRHCQSLKLDYVQSGLPLNAWANRIIIIIIHRFYIAPYPFWLNAQGALQHSFRQNKLQTWQENCIYMYTIKKEYLSSKRQIKQVSFKVALKGCWRIWVLQLLWKWIPQGWSGMSKSSFPPGFLGKRNLQKTRIGGS